MNRTSKSQSFNASTLIVAALVLLALLGSLSSANAQETGQPVARKIGAIKSVNGNALVLTEDAGTDVPVTVQPNARILRIAPGAKDLKDATPMQIQDLQVGDRVRVRGQASADGASIAALEVIVMAHTDVEAHHAQEQQDWQKRGLGGLVDSVDAAAGTVTISVTGFGGKKTIAVHTSSKTIIRRYAPDSVKFDDAKASTLQEIRPGDQLRARGDHSADGLQLTADEVVTGSFRNIAGIVNSVDTVAGTLTVQDLLSKKPMMVKITSESQLHKMPPEVAQRIAMRLKVAASPASAGTSGANGAAGAQSATPAGVPAGAGNGGMRQGGRAPDFQQMLSRMPTVAVADLHKGDAVLVVATEGTAAGATAITLLSGVEPILQAAPTGSQAMVLTPWSLGGAPGGEAMQ
jgi:hypothetical protein